MVDLELVLSSAAVSALISVAGAWISSLITKSTATKTAKITAQAELERLLTEQEFADKIRHENRTWDKEDNAHDTYKKLFTAVNEYMVKPDRNTKAVAVAACTDALLIAKGSKKSIEQLFDLIQHSDPFDSMDSATVTPLLLQIIENR